MKPYICYKIIPEKKLVLEYFCGNLSWKDLMENKKILALDKNYDPTFNIIDDVRDAYIVFEEDGISEFVKLINENINLKGERKTAILTDTPNQLVNSELLNSRDKDVLFKLKTVSTLEAATKWVNTSPSDFNFIENSLAELKNNA